MIKKLLVPVWFLFIAIGALAQQEKGIYGIENWLNLWTEFKPSKNEFAQPSRILVGDINKDTKLYKKDVYLLMGNVFVTDSATLTIEPGTVILGDVKTKGSLTIADGSKIIAEGTQTDPIVFSSNADVRKKGDWGGVFIHGSAPVNKIGSRWNLNMGLNPPTPTSTFYGGENLESNSGILRYVRIEYAGNRTKDYGYFNGLTLAGVGNQTVIENVMVSYCQGNSFYVRGGNVNLYNLISFHASRADFKFEDGTNATIHNSLAARSPYVSAAGKGTSLIVASHSDEAEVDLTKENTTVSAKNLTLLNLSKDINADMDVGLVDEAVYVTKDASLTMDKSVLSGFKPAVIFDRAIKISGPSLEKIRFTNMYFNNCRGNIFVAGNSNNEDLENWYGNSAFFNVYSKGQDRETFIDAHNLDNPDFRLRIDKIIAINEQE
jgi:hypothetical protein